MKTFSQFITEAEQRLKLVSLKHGTSSDSAKKSTQSVFATQLASAFKFA